MKKWLIIGGALILLVVGAILAYTRWGGSNGANTAQVRRGVISATVETTGSIRPARQVRLSPQVTGTVARVAVATGDVVEPGDLLLELREPALERAVRQAELSLEIQELQLQQARYGGSDAEIAIATARLRQATVVLQAAQEEYDEIAGQEGASTSDEAIALEGAKVNYEIAKAGFDGAVNGADADRIALLTKQRDLAALGLESARDQLAQTRLLAPFAGTVLAIDVRPEEAAYARNPLLTLADLTRLEVVAQIDEIDIGAVAEGQEVEIMLDAFPGQRLRGQINHIAPAATPQRGSTVYEATIAFSGEGLRVRPDMGTNVTIITLAKEDALLVPNRAIQRVGQAQVVRVLEGRKAQEREVVVGLSNRDETEILEGLREGETVLLE
ncbi:MAG: efflux RND transporter periplasmic adaptor subunit [Chloroflexi bacterium]|nr:efflux RND transporter periplasmic adaptor subunit [Chloroflexota bacterium]